MMKLLNKFNEMILNIENHFKTENKFFNFLLKVNIILFKLKIPLTMLLVLNVIVWEITGTNYILYFVNYLWYKVIFNVYLWYIYGI